ncbi:hypothetical protein CES87_29090 [Pseudomonas sp. ERMR1:02]|nr:hypothetical protein CES87_29090 [Pseudomonas sp. ERMR1:02]
MFLALALAARAIVVLICGLFNCHGFDVGIRPLVELNPVEANALFSDGKFANVRPDSFVEYVPAHAEVTRCIHGSDKTGRDGRDLGRASIRHRASSPAAYRRAGKWIVKSDEGCQAS